MPRKSKKRSAEEAVAKQEDEASPPKRPARGEENDEDDAEEVENKEFIGVKSSSSDDDAEKGEEEDLEANDDDEEVSGDNEEEGDGHDDDDEQMVQENDDETAEDAEDEGNNENDEAEDDEETGGDGDDPLLRIRKINVAGRPAEAGVIKTIYVENFMCHAKLTVDLCRNVNFINGQNGSGKSAILAAIQICLGSSAKRTNRGRNLKDLVRKEAAGKNPNTSAKIRVTLLNGGGDAYKPDIYGDKITIERCISLRGGYNGYKLLNANEKEVSRSKKDLDELLDYLNIQVDNPVAILSQEDAKKFLQGKAEDKYKFFMQATELERIDRTFVAVVEQTEDLENKKATLTDSLQAKVELVKTLERKVEEFQAVDRLEKKRLDTEVDFAWAFFGERDADHAEAVEKMNHFQKRVEAKQLELTQAEEEASGANDDDEEKRIRARMVELQNEADSQTILKRDLEAELKLAQVPVKQLRQVLKRIDGEKKTANQNLSRAKKRLKDARDEMLAKAGSAESEAARRTAQLNETEEALAQAKGETDAIKESVATCYQIYEENEPEFDQAKLQTSRKSKELSRAKTSLHELRSSSANDAASIFGPKCSRMKKLIDDNRRRFKGEVIGPIGAYLKIAPGKEKYAELVEMCIGNNTLDRFIVTNDHDRKLCQKLREQAKCYKECGLFQVKVSDRFNVPPPPAKEVETVASALIVSNDIVFNCLVDNARIDQRALAESKEMSEKYLLNCDSNGSYSIKGNINQVTFLPKGDTWNVRGGAIALNSNERKFRERRIGVDLTAAIEESQKEVRALDAELKELRKVETDISRRRADLKRQWNEKQKAKRANEELINKLTRKKEEIENEMETTADTTIDTTELEEDVAQAEQTLADVKDREATTRKEIEEKLPGVEDVKKRREEVETRNEKVLEDMKEADANLEKCLARLTQSEADLQKKRDKVKKYTEVIQKHQESVDNAEEERAKALRGARRLTLRKQHKEERDEAEGVGASQQVTQDFTDEELEQVEIMSVPKDAKSYEAKLKRIKDKIVKERERRDLSNEDPTVAIEKHSRAKQDLNETQATVDSTQEVLQDLQRDMRERRRRWKKIRRHLEDMTDSRFDQILQLNQSSGNLEFDDASQALNLVVQKNKNDPNSQTKDVKALSGGERSYTTISLLLALGESLETPFRVLDEFDVFLDTQARKLTIQTLIHVAKQMEHRQFIFITPQDLSSVTPDNKLKIFKLKPPERNQQAGGPVQQTLSFSQRSG